MTAIDKIAWIRLESGKILSTRSHGKDVYYIPGGKREPGETDIQTLIREIHEELAVAIGSAQTSVDTAERTARRADQGADDGEQPDAAVRRLRRGCEAAAPAVLRRPARGMSGCSLSRGFQTPAQAGFAGHGLSTKFLRPKHCDRRG